MDSSFIINNMSSNSTFALSSMTTTQNLLTDVLSHLLSVSLLLLGGASNNNATLSSSLSSSPSQQQQDDDDGMSTVCEACGWLAAIGSMLAFGSFAVPVKSEASQRVQVDPLVFQSYKTIMCFLTSWLILLFGHEFTYTPWGIVSGLFWVPGGVATIYAVQCAGLAVAIGIGSTGIVLVSFTWGIFVFQEPVRSKAGACLAVALMVTGLFGMAYFSTPSSSNTTANDNSNSSNTSSTLITTKTTKSTDPSSSSVSSASGIIPNPSTALSHHVDNDEVLYDPNHGTTGVVRSKRRARKADYHGISQQQQQQGTDDQDAIVDDDDHNDDLMHGMATLCEDRDAPKMDDNLHSSSSSSSVDRCVVVRRQDVLVTAANTTITTAPTSAEHLAEIGVLVGGDDESNRSSHEVMMVFVIPFCAGGARTIKLPKRQVGICAAIFNGAWGGSVMAPMKWCHRKDTNGIGFLLSFAIGASIVNVVLWIIRYFYILSAIHNNYNANIINNNIHSDMDNNNNTTNAVRRSSGSSSSICCNGSHWYQAYQQLPSFHIHELWCAGMACGLLWSTGNFFSLISVQYLGQGVGYSVIQASMLVAGLWGICYFREVTNPSAICKWFLSASLTVSGILLLSYEHHSATTAAR